MATNLTAYVVTVRFPLLDWLTFHFLPCLYIYFCLNVLNGLNCLKDLNGLIDLKGLKGLKGLNVLKGLKGLKVLNDLQGLKGVLNGMNKSTFIVSFITSSVHISKLNRTVQLILCLLLLLTMNYSEAVTGEYFSISYQCDS